MKKTVLLLSFIVFAFTSSYGQNLWKKVSEERLSNSTKMERATNPREYQLYSLDLNLLKNQLALAPLDSSGSDSNVVIPFPSPDGKLQNYIIYEAPIMEKGLSDKFPDNKSYVGLGLEDKTARIRFSTTMYGLHVMSVSGKNGTFYIDTYTKDLNNYIVYSRKSVEKNRFFTCGVTDNEVEQKFADGLNKKAEQLRVADGKFRNYRLAIACTIEYSAYHVNLAGLNAAPVPQRRAAVLAAMVVSMTRINGVYEVEMALRMNLVASNDLIIFITSDAFTNSPAMINEIQPIVDAAIGFANYDIGHGYCTTDSGVAQLSSPCGTGKARGITGQINPVGDPFDIDYVAHEMGHQWGATHTQNNNCNRSAVSSYEPGSASTILGYAGICAPNVQSNSDAHFHSISIDQMTTFVTNSNSCGVWTDNFNAAPVVNAGLDYTIPNGTAFILKGAATDANGDALTYCWEQYDNQVSTQPPTQTATVGPNYRSNPPTSSPDRYMPEIDSVVANNLAPTWEVTPTVARTMNFALTVRDNRSPNGGQSGRDDMVVTTAVVGPFLVNIPSATGISWVVGSNQTVTWAVAGTTANNINAAFVDILLSNDGGFTYPIVLASKVPNDGSEQITVPNNVGTNKRIMIRGYKHIFYDISNNDFTITAAPSSFLVAFSGVEEQQNKEACQGTNVSYNITYQALAGFSGTTTFTATGLPAGAVATFSPASMTTSGTVVMTISNTASSPAGTYNIIARGTSGANIKTAPFYFTLFSSNFGVTTLSTPANNAINQSNTPTLTWVANPNATAYDVQVSTTNTFATLVSSGTVTTNSYSVPALNTNTDYFWRVLPKNTICGNGTFTSPFTFRTNNVACNTIASPNVPVTISASGTPTVTSTINITSGGTISDVNVNLNITHTWINDLTATLTSPTGTVVQLFARQCNPNASVNDINATFDDSGVAIVCGNSPGIGGTVLPAQVLSAFNGQSAVGVWTLTVSDAFNVDGGAINSWSLNICANTLPLEVVENTFLDFALYPNPNNGEFTIKFNSLSSENVKINVHDIRGREMFQKSYTNNGTFNQNINLNTVEAGVYLVTITEGTRKIVKRIVIQ